jgi:hypothetical protein
LPEIFTATTTTNFEALGEKFISPDSSKKIKSPVADNLTSCNRISCLIISVKPAPVLVQSSAGGP